MGGKPLYGSVGAESRVVGQVPGVDVITVAAVTVVNVTLTAFGLWIVKWTVPVPPGTRLGVAVAVATIASLTVPEVACPVPAPEVATYAEAMPPPLPATRAAIATKARRHWRPSLLPACSHQR